MKIYESAVRKPISTILLFVGVMVFGLFSLMNLAVDQYPEIEIPQISVITMYPGANAADIETNITRVLEDNLNTVSNLKKLTSKSQDNVSMITVEFEYGSDLNEGANEIRDVVSRVQSQLPDDIDYPTIFKFSTSMIPVMMLAVTAEESYPALNKILDDKLVNVLNRVDGVGAVSIIGAPEREVQVNVDPAKLEAYNLTVEQLGQIIAAENVNIPSGTIDVGNNTFNIKADGEFKLSDEMRKVVVSNAGGRTVRLSDVAQIRDTLEKATMDERVNGQRGVRVMFQKQSGANTVNIVHEIQSRLPEIQKTLPKDVKMELIFEGSQEITDAIRNIRAHGLSVRGLFILGSDDQEAGVGDQLADFVIQNHIQGTLIQCMYFVPGTPVYEANRDRLLHQDWSKYNGNAVHFPRRMTPYQLQLEHIRASRKIYSWRRLFSALVREDPIHKVLFLGEFFWHMSVRSDLKRELPYLKRISEQAACAPH